jgi:hypothetical protein
MLLDMSGSRPRFLAVFLSRIAAATLLPLVLLFSASSSEMPDFSGVWVETHSVSGPPLRLQLVQSDSKVQIRTSRNGAFSDPVFGVGTIENGSATWTSRQGCIARFQWPGYDYGNPGINTFTLSLRDPEPGQPGPLLVFLTETHWNAPCASNHPIGIERVERTLQRR